MQGDIAGLTITDSDVQSLAMAIASMPATDDAGSALERFRTAGFRMVTLSNSPPLTSPTPLERAGLAGYFERHLSVDAVRCFKPAPACYQHVADTLDVPTRNLCLVACHAWDTFGAQAVGCQGAFIRRPGNANIPISGVSGPTFVADDLGALATLMGCLNP